MSVFVFAKGTSYSFEGFNLTAYVICEMSFVCCM